MRLLADERSGGRPMRRGGFFALLMLVGVLLGPALVRAEVEEAPKESVIEPPSLVEEAAPEYPEDAFQEGIEGPVLLEIEIDEEGRLTYAIVRSAPDSRLAWAALGAVARMRFLPARMNGEPIPVRVSYTLTFTIDETERERALEEEEARRLAEGAPEEAPVNFSGRVFVAGERRAIAGALVWIEGTELEAVTDEDGAFSFRGAPSGEQVVHVEATGFEPFVAKEELASSVLTEARYFLRRRPGSRFETVVRSRKSRREVTKRVLTQKELERVPGTFGDAIRVVQRLPGVARAPFGLGAVVVRGGAPDDSAILIDGHDTRLLFHLGAGPSVINSDLVEQLEFYPGGFGARFGRSHAGVVDVKTRDPNFETFAGEVGVDLLQTSFRLEGPMLGGAFFFAGRRSYVAEVLNIAALAEHVVDLRGTRFTLAPRYFDYQGKAAWKLGGGHVVGLTVLGSDDVLDFAIDATELGPSVPERTGIQTGFHRVYPTWRFRSAASHEDGRPFFRAYASPLIEQSYSENRFDESLFRLEVTRLSLEAEAELRPMPWLGILVGTDDVLARFETLTDVPALLPDERLFPRPATSSPPRYELAAEVQGNSFGLFSEVDLSLGPLLLIGGLRADLWTYYDQVRTALDPRLRARLEVMPGLSVKASVGLYHKLPSPFELADGFGNPELPVEEGTQLAFGVEHWLTRSTYLEWEVFYRTLRHLPVLVTSPLDFDPSGAPRIQPIGEGRVFGSEVMLRQHLDYGFFGWIAYTLLRSERRYPSPDEDHDDPRWRLASLDQTHVLSVALSYQLPFLDLEVGGALRYVTGNPQTYAAGGIFDADTSFYRRIDGPHRGGRLPAFFQIDLRIDKRFVFDTWQLGLYLDIQNATNHTNYEFFTYNYDFSEVKGFPGLPFIPVVGAEASF